MFTLSARGDILICLEENVVTKTALNRYSFRKHFQPGVVTDFSAHEGYIRRRKNTFVVRRQNVIREGRSVCSAAGEINVFKFI